MVWVNRRLDKGEEKISTLEDRAEEMTQNTAQRDKDLARHSARKRPQQTRRCCETTKTFPFNERARQRCVPSSFPPTVAVEV